MLGPSWAEFLSVGVDYLPLGKFLYRGGRFLSIEWLYSLLRPIFYCRTSSWLLCGLVHCLGGG
jgi:hypothetical protein